MNRVVITGMGAVTPLGNNVREFWQGIRSNKTAFDYIHKLDASEMITKLAAEVRGFAPGDIISPREMNRLDLFAQYAIAASAEAVSQSEIDIEQENRDRCGCIIGSGFGGITSTENCHKKAVETGKWKMSPLFIPMMLNNMASGNVAIFHGLKGKVMGVATACATGTTAIGEAFRSIKLGEADLMLAGGAEAPVSQLPVSGFEALKAMSESQDPKRCSIPFDKKRDGFVIGEGAGVVVLEELEHARKRNADILAEVVGYGASCDASHITLPAQDGSGAAHSMQLAIQEANVPKTDIIYINAHGTSTRQNDRCETIALKKVFGSHAYKLRVNSTKSMIGHLLGAAGAVEAIVCVKTLMENYIHPTVGYQESEEELDLNYVAASGMEEETAYALSNSLGFGGHNASLLFKKYAEGA